jgi:general nucleoside transport system ATP-binding protein
MNDQTQKLILEMRGISKRFPGVIANDNVNLHLHEGEVLALLGENGAGKSTLMNILVGLYRQDEGEILVRGEPVQIDSPRDSSDLGIGMVHQNFMLVPTMTVTENIILGMAGLPLVPDIREISKRIRALSEQYHLQVDPEAKIWQLSVGEQQRVEILKLIYRGAEILILDEPTAVLTPQEANELQEVLKIMTSEDKSAVFITHKMEEVMAFSDRVMVLQNGKLTATRKTSETSPKELARLMVGRDVLFRLEKEDINPGENVLELINIKVKDDRGLPALRGVSLTIRSGEILGIAGVAGNGQDQLAEVVTGLRTPTSGKVLISNQDATNNSPLGMIQSGVSHIPADRMGMGTVGNMQVSENLVMKGYRNEPISSGGFIRPKKILEFAKHMIESFRIATPTPKTRVKFLSGGNIQKTILAREIDSCEALMVAVYPSRGLDVGATEAVRNMLLEQRQKGMGVLLISEDLDELTSIADRIAVMFEGEIMGVIDSDEADIEMLGLMMSGTRLETLRDEADILAREEKD